MKSSPAVFFAAILVLAGIIGCTTLFSPSRDPSAPTLDPGSQGIIITSPQDGGSVDYRSTVQGISSLVYGSSDTICVIIRPAGSGDFWVQPAVTVSENGDWSALAYFGGDASAKYRGTQFEVYAVITPAKLNEGKVSVLPAGMNHVVRVSRK